MNPRRRSVALVALLLASCSQADAVAQTTTTSPTSPTTITTTTTTASTTRLAVTQVAALPVPEAPPEPHAVEAVVVLGAIEVPRIDLKTTLYQGIAITTFDRGPSYWPGTALPGAMGNVVVGGHRTSKARPFRHLEKLVPGDEVIFTTGGGRFVYHVIRTEIVTPDAIWITDQTEAYTATLFACHPVGSTKERIVVFLELSV